MCVAAIRVLLLLPRSNHSASPRTQACMDPVVISWQSPVDASVGVMKHGKGNISSLPILSHMKCKCDVMFRNCCVSVDGCMDSLQSITLFNTFLM